MSLNKPLILEHFVSIQGENIYIGIPSIVIRFGGRCNLSNVCYFCDTKYAQTEPPTLTIQDSINFIKEHPQYSHIVITGSEPMLYQDSILQLLNSFTHDELLTKTITIETNCTMYPKEPLRKLMKYYNGIWSVSPKLIDGTNWHIDVIQYMDWQQNSYFKFVIDIPIAKEIKKIQGLYDSNIIDKPFVVVQPNGLLPDYNKSCRDLADYIISNNLTNFRVLPQFHKICWGNQRNK